MTDRRKTVGAAASGTFAAGCPAIARPPHRARNWHSRQGSNLQPAVLETAVPSLELREYKKPPLESNQPCLHTRAALQTALRRPYKTAPVLRQGCCLTHIPSGSLLTPSGIQSSLVAREVKRAALWGMSPCAIRCEVTESNRSTKLPAPLCGFPNLA